MIKTLLGMLVFVFAALPAICSGQAVQPVEQNGATITFTAATTAPTPVQASSSAAFTQQYIITNAGSVSAFIAIGPTSAQATANCKIPTAGTSQTSIPILPLAAFILSAPPSSYFCGITASSSAVIYVTPGVGQ